jgi:hypothetical protein
MGRAATAWSRFTAWRRRRPFVGGVLTVLAGIEMFFSGQLDIGKIHVQVGIEGLQATIIPIILVVLGILAMSMPVHRVFYGIISLVVSVYSLIGVNLGGFFIGMLLGSVGGILIVSWMPKKAATAHTHAAREDAAADTDASAGATMRDDAALENSEATGDAPLSATIDSDDSSAEPPPLVQRRH